MITSGRGVLTPGAWVLRILTREKKQYLKLNLLRLSNHKFMKTEDEQTTQYLQNEHNATTRS
eukprot:m.266025 g.266025  ORF g.266025 m.266025 type:complete len:62 (+) comp64962_c0_seq1:1245-1430(+)